MSDSARLLSDAELIQECVRRSASGYFDNTGTLNEATALLVERYNTAMLDGTIQPEEKPKSPEKAK